MGVGGLRVWRERVFPGLAGVIWLVFLFLDITRLGDSTWVKFAGICLCCLTALLGAKTTDGKLVAAAQCFTVGADWFLLVLNRNYLVGFLLFMIVQFCYMVRLGRMKSACLGFSSREERFFRRLQTICWALPLPLLLLTMMIVPSLPDLWVVLFYFCMLVLNTVTAFALKKRIFSIGLLLFVCCDVCVGLYNLGLFTAFTRVGMWLFYLPSQALIVLSQEWEKGDFYEKAV